MPLDDPPVGYKNPPMHTRWPKGTSGSPRGRKRGSKNWKTLFEEAMAAKIAVSEDGRRRRVSKEGSMFIRLANQAARGDPKARPEVRRIREYIERTTPPEKAPEDKPRRGMVVVILPHNDRQPLHPDLKALYMKAHQHFCDTHRRCSCRTCSSCGGAGTFLGPPFRPAVRLTDD